MVGSSAAFKDLFKKYRLKAEFDTLSKLGLALAGKGIIYEDSIFSHWQKGSRIPQNRIILLKLIEIFIERRAIETIDQANEFLSSAGLGYLSEEELQKIPTLKTSIFQVPHEVADFNGRTEIINKLIYEENIEGKVILLHGSAGVGKTALAIKLGYLLKDKFNDGVLWYKVEEDNIMDILLSIAHIFGENISHINNLQVRATVVRSLLSSKKVLLFLDSAELSNDIHLLIPNSPFCTVIVTSQKNQFKISIHHIDIKVVPFTDKEVLLLFKDVLQEKYSHYNADNILAMAKKVGNLPLALHILAKQLLHTNVSISHLPDLFIEEKSLFKEMFYEEKNLDKAIAASYKKLDDKMRAVLVSVSIFKGKDFSVKSVAYINGLSIPITTHILKNLVNFSLLEYSVKQRYRIHPAIQDFLRKKLDNPSSSFLISIATAIFVLYTFGWVYLQLFVDKESFLYPMFSATYCFMALYGGICGIHTALRWGGFKTLIGKAIFLFSFGLFSQVFGQITYSYYTNFKDIPVPYPSLGDIGYFGTIPFYIYGVTLLAQSSGITISIQSFQKKIIALVIPLGMLTIAYLLFLQSYTFNFANPLKVFLDFAYPLGEAIYISIAIVTYIFSRNVLDGIMRSKAFFVLIALVIQFFADYIFLYNQSNFYPGSPIDYIYLISYFTMTIALLFLRSLKVKVKNI